MQTIITSSGAKLINAQVFQYESIAQKRERENAEKTVAGIPKTIKRFEEEIMADIEKLVDTREQSYTFDFTEYSSTFCIYNLEQKKHILKTIKEDFSRAGYYVHEFPSYNLPTFIFYWKDPSNDWD